CEFWSFDQDAVAGLHRASWGDAEFEASIKERNERRRGVISAITSRMAERGEIRPETVSDLTDLLFVLTSFPVFSELTAKGRTVEAACVLIQRAAAGAISGASPGGGEDGGNAG